MVFQLNPIILWGTQKSPGFYVEVRPCGVGSPLLSMGSGIDYVTRLKQVLPPAPSCLALVFFFFMAFVCLLSYKLSPKLCARLDSQLLSSNTEQEDTCQRKILLKVLVSRVWLCNSDWPGTGTDYLCLSSCLLFLSYKWGSEDEGALLQATTLSLRTGGNGTFTLCWYQERQELEEQIIQRTKM